MKQLAQQIKRSVILFLSIVLMVCCTSIVVITAAAGAQNTSISLPTNPDVNGWDVYNSTDGYSYYTDEEGAQVAFAYANGAQNSKNMDNGYTKFDLQQGGSVINVTPLNVAKTIYFDIEINSIGTAGYSDFYIVMYDEISDMFFNADGTVAQPGFLSTFGNANPVLRMHEAVGMPSEDEGFWEGILRASPYWGDTVGYTINADYAAAPAGTCAIELNQKFTLKLEISATEGESKLYFNDTLIAALNFTQADFTNGNAYVGFLSTGATNFTVTSRVGQYETVEFDESVPVFDENGEAVTELVALRGESVLFKIEGNYSVKIGDTIILENEDGYYNFVMPAGGGVITFEEIKDYFITFKANGYVDYIVGVSKDSPNLTDEVIAYLQETYKEDQYTVHWMNGEEEFDLTSEITDNMVLVGKFVENENYAMPDINGWDSKSGKNATVIPGMQTSEIYGAYHGELESRMDGTSTFTLEGAGYILNANRIDITRPFRFSYSESLYHDISDTAYLSWSLWESFTMGQVIDADGWKESSNSVLSIMYRSVPDCKIFDDFGVRKGFTVVPGATDFWKEELKVWDVYIGETAEEGYIKLNGVLVGVPTVTQSDFCAGYAYMYLMNFERTVYDQVSIVQSFKATIKCDENASYTIEEQKDDYSTYNFGEVYTLNITVDEGYYLESVTVNGDRVKLTDGKMKVYLAWGGADIVITTSDTLPVYTVTLRVRNQSSTVTVNMGDVFTPEDAVLEGYEFLGWYTDSNFINEYVPTVIEEDITLFARMSRVVDEDPDDDTNLSDTQNGTTGCGGFAGGVSAIISLASVAAAGLWLKKKK